MRKSRIVTIVHRSLVVLVILAVFAGEASCVNRENNDSKIDIVVTILPQAEFVEAIGGDRVNVTVMIPPGASPHVYEPLPQQMIALSKASLYAKVGSGVEFELSWLDKLIAQNPEILVVDCSLGIDLIEANHDDHNDNHSHSHGNLDPHIWTSVLNAKIMAENIYYGLIQVDPENTSYYQDNLNKYLDDLENLHQEITSGFSGVKNPVFMIYHPSMGYFAKAYGLLQLPVEEDGKEPTSKGIASVIKQAEEHNVKVIFTSPQFNPQNAQVIASEIDGVVVPIDPLVREYINNMRSIFEIMLEAMQYD